MSKDGWAAFYCNGFQVLDPIEPGYSVRAPLRPFGPAYADVTEAHALPYTDEQAGVVVSESDRIDLDVMEHTRQSRLRRFQEQRL